MNPEKKIPKFIVHHSDRIKWLNVFSVEQNIGVVFER